MYYLLLTTCNSLETASKSFDSTSGHSRALFGVVGDGFFILDRRPDSK